MSRHWHTTAIGAICAMMPLSRASAQLRPEVIARTAIPAVASVMSYDESGRLIKQGSGFLVSGTEWLVTNAHVIRSASRVDVVFGHKRAIRGVKVLAYKPTSDLAVIAIPNAGASALRLEDASHRPVAGAPVYVVGNPLGLESTFSDGIVSGWRRNGTQQLLQITAPISPGSSGGPVLSAEGRVIGVAAASLTKGQNLNFAVPVRELRAVLAAVGSHARPLRLPLVGDVRSGTATSDEVVAMLTSYPLMWGPTDAKAVLGVPDQETNTSSGEVALKFRHLVLNHAGTLTILIDPFTGSSQGTFRYELPPDERTSEYLKLRRVLTTAFGDPAQVIELVQADVILVRWDQPDLKRSFMLSVNTNPWDEHGDPTRPVATFDISYMALVPMSQSR